jgi:hypothetical protein
LSTWILLAGLASPNVSLRNPCVLRLLYDNVCFVAESARARARALIPTDIDTMWQSSPRTGDAKNENLGGGFVKSKHPLLTLYRKRAESEALTFRADRSPGRRAGIDGTVRTLALEKNFFPFR